MSIQINDNVWIDEDELSFVASRSTGPGGQHVNKVSTKITLRFDVEASRGLSDEQRKLVMEGLATRINKNGILSVSSQRHRSQSANREAAVEKFAALIKAELTPRRARRATRPSRSAKQRRLEEKRRRSDLKRRRDKADIRDF